MSSDVLSWVAADSFVASPVARPPSILRFSSDDFMQRMLQLLAEKPEDLPSLVATSESWTAPTAQTQKLIDPNTDPRSRAARTLARRKSITNFRRASIQRVEHDGPVPLKLFQPVHQRFYVAAAHLVCEQPGLPTRRLQARDRSGFVIRRLFTVNGQPREHGFVRGSSGRGVWVPIAAPDQQLARGEELLPVFPLSYTPPVGQTRTLSAGLIPAAQHDDYVFAGRQEESPDGEPAESSQPSAADDLKALALTKVIGTWGAVLGMAGGIAPRAGKPDHDPPSDNDIKQRIIETNTALVESSWRALQEISEWLHSALPDVFNALSTEEPNLEPRALALHGILRAAKVVPKPAELDPNIPLVPSGTTLAAAILGISAWSAKLDAAEKSYVPKPPPAPAESDWPTAAFPLALLEYQSNGSVNVLWPLTQAIGLPEIPAADKTLNALKKHFDESLVKLYLALCNAVEEAAEGGKLVGAKPAHSDAAQLAQSLAAQQAENSGEPAFVLRFVHLRCDCGPLAPPVVSVPSEQFQLAGFFDPDAPLRPIRIALPFDITPGGLRKHTKNSAFIVSDLLCGQMTRVRKLGLGDLVLSVLPWPFYKKLDVSTEDGPCGASDRFGMICSLSIPIITIVAFVLLIVIATLLELIFHWLPFLMVCFPIPGFKGKLK